MGGGRERKKDVNKNHNKETWLKGNERHCNSGMPLWVIGSQLLVLLELRMDLWVSNIFGFEPSADSCHLLMTKEDLD